MSQNIIDHQEFAVTIAATIKKELPILERINKTLSNEVKSGGGDVVGVLIPNYRKMSRGVSFLPDTATTIERKRALAALKNNIQKRQVSLSIKKMGSSYDVLEKTLKLFTKQTQITEPTLSKFASWVNTDIFQKVLSSACASVVSVIDGVNLSEAISYVENSRIGDENSGMINPVINNTLASSPNFRWNASSIETDLYKGVLGEYMGCEFFKSADAGIIRYAGSNTDFAFSGNAEFIGIDNKESCNLALTNLGSLEKIKMGTPIQIYAGGTAPTPSGGTIDSPFTVSDAYGNNMELTRTFIVAENPDFLVDEDYGTDGIGDGSYKVVSGSVTVKLAPVFLNKTVSGVTTESSFPVANTWFVGASDPAASGATYGFVCPLLGGTKYALGAVFASNSVAFAGASLKPLAGIDSASSTIDGELNVRSSYDGDILEGEEMWRVETLYGCDALFGQGAVALYGQIL